MEWEDMAGTAAVAVALALTLGLLWAWPLMLLFGVLHGSWPTVIPAFGYWASYLIYLGISLIRGK